MKLKQDRAPIFEALLAHAKKRMVSFHTPGHKNGEGIDDRLRKFTGRNLYYMDVTVFPAVDSLHDPVGPIREAQQLMAQAYGVKQSFMLVNGSTVGNQIMLMSACNPGDSVILSRSAHKSVMGGIIQSGVWPIWIQPRVDQDLDLILDCTPEQVEQAIQQFPEAKAVFVTSPTYNGVVTDLRRIAEICHARGKILLVDEAHGPHLHFHRDFPVAAVEAGADLCVQSIHKILSGLSQGSVLHFNTDLIDITRVTKIVSMLQTTSPNYLILASLDLARRQAELFGERLLDKVIQVAEEGRRQINRLRRFTCFTRADARTRGYDLDVTKLTINVTRTGLSGQEVAAALHREYNVQVDCADLFNLIAIMGIGSTPRDMRKLVGGLKALDAKAEGHSQNWTLQLPSLATELVMNPRDVFFKPPAAVRRVTLNRAAGQISAQTLTPYPPGIPVLIPGERISQEVVDYLMEFVQRRIRVVGQETDALRTITVVKT